MPVKDDAVEFLILVTLVGRDKTKELSERLTAVVTSALSGEGGESGDGPAVLVRSRPQSRRPFGELQLDALFQSAGKYYRKSGESTAKAVEADGGPRESEFAADRMVVVVWQSEGGEYTLADARLDAEQAVRRYQTKCPHASFRVTSALRTVCEACGKDLTPTGGSDGAAESDGVSAFGAQLSDGSSVPPTDDSGGG